MGKRTLSEIAYDTYLLPGFDLSNKRIDAALEEAGIDPINQKERERFRRLVIASQPHHKEDQLARCRFAEQAREQCGDNANIDQVIQKAYELDSHYTTMEEEARKLMEEE
jgi:hypothetical protein